MTDAKAAAFFDLDRTIIAGSSVFTFGIVAYKAGLVSNKQLIKDIITRLMHGVRREARGLIDLHADAGRDTFIVSASPIEIVGKLAEEMEMTGGLGTVSEVENGIYTGALAQPFCYGEGKADALHRIADERGYNLEASYAYTDSAGDLPMLEAVGHPVAVNPDRALETIAYHRGWPIVEFSRTKKKVVKRTTAASGAAILTISAYALGRYTIHG